MLEIAIGEMELRKDEFDSLTPKEFFYIYNGYKKKIEFDLKNAWEPARLIAFYVGASNSKSIRKVTDIIKFPWEIKESVQKQKMTKNQFLELKNKWEKAFK